jgi:hypothetical protein
MYFAPKRFKCHRQRHLPPLHLTGWGCVSKMSSAKSVSRPGAADKNGSISSASKSASVNLPSVWSRAFSPASEWPDKVRFVSFSPKDVTLTCVCFSGRVSRRHLLGPSNSRHPHRRCLGNLASEGFRRSYFVRFAQI